MATKKPTKTEIMDIPEDLIIKVDTAPVGVVSMKLDTTDEALMPSPVPASGHVQHTEWRPIKFRQSKIDKYLPWVAMLAIVTTGLTIFALGIYVGGAR